MSGIKNKITGQRMCWGCSGRISLGFDELDREVLWPTQLRDIVGEGGPGNRFWILSCSHQLIKGLPLLSAQEFETMPDGSIRRGSGLIFGRARPQGRTTGEVIDRLTPGVK